MNTNVCPLEQNYYQKVEKMLAIIKNTATFAVHYFTKTHGQEINIKTLGI